MRLMIPLFWATLVCCVSGCSPWYYEGPDLSANTVGPIILTQHGILRACGQPAYGCTSCTKQGCVIYVLEGMPQSVIDHEWRHAKGWNHP